MRGEGGRVPTCATHVVTTAVAAVVVAAVCVFHHRLWLVILCGSDQCEQPSRRFRIRLLRLPIRSGSAATATSRVHLLGDAHNLLHEAARHAIGGGT